MTDLQDLLRGHGKERVVRVLEEAGYAVQNNRLKCPFQGCHDQPFERRGKNAALFTGSNGIPRVKCHRCDTTGTLIDVLMAVRGWNLKESIDFLKGAEGIPIRPALRVVGEPPPEHVDPEKLKPEQVKRIWEGLDKEDGFGDALAYLEKRGLERAVEFGLVKFPSVRNADKSVANLAKRGFRLAMLTRDITGNPLGIQARLTRQAAEREHKINSVPGSTMARTFFGTPELMEDAALVCVTEGMADTLAVQLWAGVSKCVVGAPGMHNLAHVAEEAKRTGISLEGKLFLLFPQNDRPKNASRGRFKRLAGELHKLGATTIFCSVPDEYEDVADYRKSHPAEDWPPEQFKAHLETDVETGEKPLLTNSELGLSLPTQFESKSVTKNLSTLLALLDDPYSREAIVRRPGEFSFCLMRNALCFEEVELREVHFTLFRHGIEQFTDSTGGRALSFTSDEVRKAVEVLCMRKPIHPVREWLRSLTWDGVPRLDEELLSKIRPRPQGVMAKALRKWFIGAVARAMNPGCKMDTVLVLTGKQGKLKSTFFDTLGGQWFADDAITPGDKDSKMVVRRSWIVEWSELAAAQKARDLETLKAFISQRKDLFRPPYAADLVEAPRHAVIVGTTNKDEFLHDDTGARRWWPIRIDGLDIDWIRNHRSQLFAEAVVAFQAGERHWFEGDEVDQIEENNRAYEGTDVWDDLVRDWLDQHPAYAQGNLTVALVLNDCIKKHEGQWTKMDQIRVGHILKRMGYERRQIRRGDERIRVYQRVDSQQQLLEGA